MVPSMTDNRIYSATYSNVPVYEFNIEGNHVMRRRSDNWINATHILKVADFDKPTRTRILEREVQKGTHEKVQGGYGKYQGTWIPLPEGRQLADRNRVLDKLRPIFDYVPGDRSPPPAPKHTTAASKPRANRKPVNRVPALSHISEDFEMHHHSETPDNVTVASESYMEDYGYPQQDSRKRKRPEDEMSLADQHHQLWAEELLDYFMLLESPNDPFQRPPVPPNDIDLDRPIDEKGHTAMHWAAAMGDLAVVKDLIGRGANINAISLNGETPLMRAVIFTNNYDKSTMDRLAGWLVTTVPLVEWFGSTVFHHIAGTTSSKSKYACARYYLDCILSKMAENYTPTDIEHVLNMKDRNGDTAIHIAARNGARKCVRSLIGRHASVTIQNDLGETADDLIIQLNHRRRDGRHRAMSSSPFQLDSASHNLLSANLDPTLDTPSSRNHNPLLASAPSQSLIPTAKPHHTSKAASALTTQIFPLLLSKSEKLAQAFDAEMNERETDIAEAERVVQLRTHEIETLKKSSMALAMSDQEDEYDGRLARQLAGLVKQCESVIEDEQREELTSLLYQISSQQSQDHDMDTSYHQTDEGMEKLQLLLEVKRLKMQRQYLVKEVVAMQSEAGMGDRQKEYRRLIVGALGVRDEDVDAMVPEIVGELEEWQGIEGGVVGVGA
ncbi:apses transcription factor [Aureobasidium pullulans]|uniref:Apses transcription factor n=1 Tax=Aureobasidium pullulans TaxID=5580 RepID=A0A4V4KIR5_AURPU|nr:apses transcription factor [Aureobasidium pullulans]